MQNLALPCRGRSQHCLLTCCICMHARVGISYPEHMPSHHLHFCLESFLQWIAIPWAHPDSRAGIATAGLSIWQPECWHEQGYLAALSASSYSYVSMLQHFAPLMNDNGAAISLTYLASERIIPGVLQCSSLQVVMYSHVSQKTLLTCVHGACAGSYMRSCMCLTAKSSECWRSSDIPLALRIQCIEQANSQADACFQARILKSCKHHAIP